MLEDVSHMYVDTLLFVLCKKNVYSFTYLGQLWNVKLCHHIKNGQETRLFSYNKQSTNRLEQISFIGQSDEGQA